MSPKELAITGMGAALYAIVGYTTYFGITFYGVRFWPAVAVPGVFAVLFGGVVGGLSAAIGIFISDMATHGNALLSLTVGVPANFLGFYIIGRISRGGDLRRMLLSFPLGLGVGSLIIGIGLMLWSQLFPLPFSDRITPMTLQAGLVLAAWTFITEIPFLYLIVPPVVKTIKRSGVL